MSILLAGPSAAQLRARFEKYAYRRMVVKATFDEMLAMFSDPNLTIKEIGKRLGITTEPTRIYYEEYFRPIIQETGWDRRLRRLSLYHDKALRDFLKEGKDIRGYRRIQYKRKNIASSARKEIIRKAQEKSLPILRLVGHEALKAGLSVYQVPKSGIAGTHSLRHWALKINGLLCRIHLLTKPRQHAKTPTSQRYLGFSLHREEASHYDAHIFVLKIPQWKKSRILVVPSYVISRIGGNRPEARAAIVIGRQIKKPKIDWWKYENAWHLLEGED